jgi:hypothetical protein
VRSRLAAAVLSVLAVTGCTAVRTGSGTVGPGSGAAPAAATETGGGVATATWGQRYTWPDGVAVEVGAPTPCTPGEYAAPDGIVRAVKVTITVVNGGKEPLDSGVLMFGMDAQHGGQKAEKVFDSGGECGGGLDSSTVLPGKTFTATQGIAVGAEPGELQLVLAFSFVGDKAIFVGQA